MKRPRCCWGASSTSCTRMQTWTTSSRACTGQPAQAPHRCAAAADSSCLPEEQGPRSRAALRQAGSDSTRCQLQVNTCMMVALQISMTLQTPAHVAYTRMHNAGAC